MVSKKKIKLDRRKIALCMIGSSIMAFGLYNVHSLSGVTEGGILGMTLLLNYWLDLSPAITGFIMNAACYLVGWKLLGWSFILYSTIAGFTFSASYAVFEQFLLAAVDDRENADRHRLAVKFRSQQAVFFQVSDIQPDVPHGRRFEIRDGAPSFGRRKQAQHERLRERVDAVVRVHRPLFEFGVQSRIGRMDKPDPLPAKPHRLAETLDDSPPKYSALIASRNAAKPRPGG